MTVEVAPSAPTGDTEDKILRLSFSKSVVEAAGMEPLPPTAIHLARLIATDDWDLFEVVKLVALDQALVIQLLGAANSAAYAGVVPVTTVEDAVRRLGAGAVVSFSIGTGVHGQMSGSSGDLALFEERLWIHSVAAALAIERMPLVCDVRLPPEAYAAALLHDIGMLVIRRFLATACVSDASSEWGRQITEFPEAECDLVERFHCDVGKTVALQWNLPESIANGIGLHHRPDEKAGVVADAIHVADVVANMAGAVSGCNSPETEVDEDVAERLGISDGHVFLLCNLIADSLLEVLDLYAV